MAVVEISDQGDERGRTRFGGNRPGVGCLLDYLKILMSSRLKIRSGDTQLRSIIAGAKVNAKDTIDLFVEIARVSVDQQKTLGEEEYQQKRQHCNAFQRELWQLELGINHSQGSLGSFA